MFFKMRIFPVFVLENVSLTISFQVLSIACQSNRWRYNPNSEEILANQKPANNNVSHSVTQDLSFCCPHLKHRNVFINLHPDRSFFKSSVFSDPKCCLHVDKRPKCKISIYPSSFFTKISVAIDIVLKKAKSQKLEFLEWLPEAPRVKNSP